MANENVNVEALIQGIQLDNPRLYQILQELNRGLVGVQEELFPLVIKDRVKPVTLPQLDAPATFSFAFNPTSVRFFWSEVPTAYGYEIRRGAVWETATFIVRLMSLQAVIDPLLAGTYTYLIKTINAAGVYSDTPRSLVITVPPIGAVTISKEVIDNNVLLWWTVPTSIFRILHYEVTKDGDIVGTVDSTFFSTFENVAGTYTYRIIAIDVAGNRGAPSDLTVEVSSPPDYALQDSRVSQLLGTRVNVLRDAYIPSLIVSWTDETWQQHYVNHSWNTIQDQLNAGFPIYIQPTTVSGASYEEVIDYGVTIHNTIVTVTFNFNMISPDVTTVIKMASSLDNVTYTPFTAGASQFIPEMRYLKLRLEFAGDSNKALMELYNLTISLSVKRENDGGEVNAVLTDVGGTVVFFTKEFKDVESITCTTKSITEPFYVIFNFNDVPNPTSFTVYVFDSTGNRVTRVVDWKARGIV